MKTLDYLVGVVFAIFLGTNFNAAGSMVIVDEPVGPPPAWHYHGPIQSYPIAPLVAKESGDIRTDLHTAYPIDPKDDKRLNGIVSSGRVDSVISNILATATGGRREYLARVIPEAVKIGVEFNIPPSGIVGMSVYESNYGTSKLATRYHNYLGMKAQPCRWNGPVASQMPTVDSGRHVRADFRAYSNLSSCILGFAEFLRETGRYDGAFHTSEGGDFVRLLHARGYCPDDDYVQNVKDIIARHKLAILDPIARDLNAGFLTAYQPEDGTLRQLVIRVAKIEALDL